MIKTQVARSRFIRWNKAFSALLMVALLVPLMVMAPASEAAPRAQSVLLQMAAERPEETVGVIVQKLGNSTNPSTGSGRRVENLVARLGGVVTRDLWIINAFAAELPGKAVPALAKAAGVRWVSLDAPVSSQEDERQIYYLHNDPVPPDGDTPSHPVLPLSQTVPTVETLYNYDSDRDARPGLRIRSGGSGADEGNNRKIQRWRFEPFEDDVRISGRVQLKFYAVMKQFQRDSYGKVWAYLIDRNGDQAQIIASGFKEKPDWAGRWKRRTIKFGEVNHVILAGHQLELVLTVDGASDDAMWFAYGTTKQAAHLKVNFLADWPNYFLNAIGVPELWSQGYQGQGVRVAVVDSGIRLGADFKTGTQSRIVAQVNLNAEDDSRSDRYGHGTYMAGIIGSNGRKSDGLYLGVAPDVEFISVRANDDWGGAHESDVVAGLQWVLEHKDEYNIRIVNLSLNSTVAQSYHTSPLDAAAEILWFNGIVVVTSAGNNGDEDQGVIYPPANDPLVIVVGATEDLGTPDPADDVLAEFSAYGTTPEGFFRPDLTAPGTYIVSSLARHSHFKNDYTDHVIWTLNSSGELVETNFTASGTSVSAAVVSGAAALLLQAMPDLNPGQVKYLLTNTAMLIPDEPGAGAGMVNVASLVQTALSYGSADAVPTADTGIMPHLMLCKAAALAAWASAQEDFIDWESVNWDSVNWDSVNWDSVNWDSVNWDSVNWDSVNWDSVNWDSVNWDSVNWDSVNWDSVNWDSVNWDSVNWDSVNWVSVDLEY